MFEAKSDNVKQNQKYFVLSSLESKDLDSTDIIECDYNHMSIESGCGPDARLQTSAAFESLVQSDLSTSQTTIFNVDAIIPVNKEKVTQGIILDSGATNHMFADKLLFRTLSMFSVENRVPIKVADGKMIWASGKGLSFLHELTPALYVLF